MQGSLQDEIAALASALETERTFEGAARTTLRAILEHATAALARSPFARKGRILRGMLHLRTGDGYQNLVVVEAESARPPSHDEPHERALPSTSAWRWILEWKRPVSIDINVDDVRSDQEGQSGQTKPCRPLFTVGKDTADRLAIRDVTHLFALPLRGDGGAIEGMVSLEASCRAAIGRPFVFLSSSKALERMVEIAERYLSTLPAAASDAPAPDELLPVIGASMARVVGILALFAEQEETLLLSGPTGSGKSRLARWCHARSARSGKAFETLDLSTVPEELQMAELVGWKRGAFTHAFKETPGALGRAEGGALFIDEIDKLSLKAQAGLLRILEDRRYRMLGEGAAEAVADVRFIAGTNANLSDLVSSGELRKDLYFRVNVLPVIVPPLVERRDEITAWAAYMLARRCKDGKDRPTAELSRGAKDILAGHPWPGNLRQLDNVVRRAHALAGRGRDVAKTLRITAEDVRSSLAYEIPAKPSLVELLHAAAVEFVEEAKRQRARGGLVDLDLADAFRGFVVAAATEREGIEQACRLLGREGAVKQRNQTRLVRHEVERAAALSSLVGGGLDASLVKVLALLEDDRDSGGLRSGRVS